MRSALHTWDATIVADVAERSTHWIVIRYPVVQPLLAQYGVSADDSRPLPEAAAANGHVVTDVLHAVIDRILRPIPWH